MSRESIEETRDTLVEICHRLYARGFVAATDGNVSARLENGNILTTRTAVNKGMVALEDLVELDASGRVITEPHQPSTELPMHLFIYQQRPDVNAVVHAHPVYATGFAAAHQSLESCVFPEVIVGLGAVPLAEYATPSTGEVGESLAPYVKIANAILLANHGVVTYGKDLWDAYFKMEKVEHAAHITFVARMLGGERSLSAEDVEKLRTVSRGAYGKDFSGLIACRPGSHTEERINETPTDENIQEIVRQMLQKRR